ncbi:MAG: succinate dehydrogenase, hydrophobic membrane anchor protein, partial [Pseudomonadota bacterium]
RDWLIQRVSAIVLAIYSIFLVIYIFSHPNMSFSTWHDLFDNTLMRVLTLLVFLNLIMHAWIGIWTVTTDYLKSVSVRVTVQILVILALISYFIWAIIILWG